MIKPTSNMDNSYKNSLSDNSLTDMDCVNNSSISLHEDSLTDMDCQSNSDISSHEDSLTDMECQSNSDISSHEDDSETDMDCVNDSTVSSHEDIFNTRLSSQMWTNIANDHETTTAVISTQTEELDIIAHLRIMHRFIQKRIHKKSVATQTSPSKEENYDYRPKKSQKTDNDDIFNKLFEMPIFPKEKKSIRQRLSELNDLN